MRREEDFPGSIRTEDSSNSPSVAVIGCGPGGMFFLHALATKRKQLEQAGDIDALMNLPIVTVFEKSASPGGVWRSDRNRDNSKKESCQQHTVDTDESANMYEGLWINGHKDALEFFDYTFEDHFKTPQPVYLPRQQILEYMMARVTKHGAIFQDVLFNTEVQSVTYDDALEQFVIVSRDKEGMISTRYFDKCIWASGLNGKPKIPKDVTNKLGDFKGQVVHSSAMDKLAGSSSSSADGKNDNAVEGKRILLIGDSYSAEDLALQCIKLGAEKIFMTSRKGSGAAAYMGSWPLDKVEMLWYSRIAGVKEDGTGKTIVFEELEENKPVPDAEDVSIIILCTGYKENLSFLDDKLQPWKKDEDCGTWCMEDVGESTTTWRMKENVLTSTIGHVEPSKELDLNSDFVCENSYRKLLISNTNMMYIYEMTDHNLLDIDVMAWLCLVYITGERPIPSREEMLETNKRELLESMQEVSIRYNLDPEFKAAWGKVPEEHWSNDTSDGRYEELENEASSYHLRVLAGYMKDANYPMSLGDINGLNEMGANLLKMKWYCAKARYDLEHCDEETKKWKTFRDSDASPYRSSLTGMGSVPLKGKWLDIDDEGNPVFNSGTGTQN